MSLKQAKNILLIRLDKIGDLILSTPLIRTLRKELPQSSITLLVSPYAGEVGEVLAGENLLDEIVPWSGESKLSPGLKNKKWDAVFALSPLTAAYQLAYSSRAPIRAGIVYSDRLIARLFCAFWLTHPLIVDIRGKLKRGEPVPHEIEQTKELLFKLGIKNFAPELRLEIEAEELLKAKAELKEQQILGFQLSLRWLRAGWQSKQLKELLLKIREKFPAFKLLIFSGSEEKKLAEELQEELKGVSGFSFAGDLGFKQWAARVSQLSALVSPDCGAVHLAAALKIGVVGVYLKETFLHCSRQWAPWQVKNQIIKMEEFGQTQENIIAGISQILEDSNV